MSISSNYNMNNTDISNNISNDIIISNIDTIMSNNQEYNLIFEEEPINLFSILSITGGSRHKINPNSKYYEIMEIISKIKFIIKSFNNFCNNRVNHSINNVRMHISNTNFVMYCKMRYSISSEEYLLEALIHLKMYLEHLKFIVLEWDDFNKNEKYNDDIYIKLCNYCKELHNLIEHDNYYNLIDCVINDIYLSYDNNFSKSIYKKYEISKNRIEGSKYFDKENKDNFCIDKIKVKIYEYHYRIVDKKWKELSSS